MSEEGQQLTPEQLLAKCVAELEDIKQSDIEKGVRFNDEQFSVLKYEANDIKALKNLTVSQETIDAITILYSSCRSTLIA